MEFSRQEYWSGLPFPPSGDLPDPGIEPQSPTLQEDSLPFEPPGKPQKQGSKLKKEKKSERWNPGNSTLNTNERQKESPEQLYVKQHIQQSV